MTEIEHDMPEEKQVLIDEYHPEQPVNNPNFGPKENILFEVQRPKLANEALRENLKSANADEANEFVARQIRLAKKFNGPGGP